MAKVFSAAVQTIVTILNQLVFRVEVVTVTTAGTPVQLPNIVVPDGVDIVIKAKIDNRLRRIYLADSAVNTGIATKRAELRAGESIGLALTNCNLIWIDASANDAQVEIIVEA